MTDTTASRQLITATRTSQAEEQGRADAALQERDGAPRPSFFDRMLGAR